MIEPNNTELIYQLEDHPPVTKSIFVAIQHLLASFVGIVTPTLIIGSALDLGSETSYLISMALIASGIGTFIQAFQPIGIGARMLCVQGTSFAFVGALISAGLSVKEAGGDQNEVLGLIITLCMLGSLIQMLLSQIIPRLQKVITPLVSGIVITAIGISLIRVGITDLAGGVGAIDFGSTQNIVLGLSVMTIIIAMNRSRNNWARLSSIIAGLIVGVFLAIYVGKLSLNEVSLNADIAIPQPFKYGFYFDLNFFLPLAVIFIISSVETTGDITANCAICGQPVAGSSYLDRVKRGVLGDGVNSLIAALLNSFPNTTFSQNNGVIQLTGIASRYIGMYLAVLLFLLGLFQGLGDFLQLIPKSVLGGATLLMFGTITATGIKILGSLDLDRRKISIIAISLGLGLGSTLVPEAIIKLPPLLQNILSSPAATAGLTAILLTLITPEEAKLEDKIQRGNTKK